MADFLIIAIVVLIVAATSRYIYKSRKRGVKCIGCPEGCSCSSKGGCAGCSGCGGNSQAE